MKWIFLLCFLSSLAQAQDTSVEQNIWNQLPDRLERTSTPARKVILVSEAPQFYHQSIPAATKTLQMLGQKTGAYRIEKTTSDLSSLTEADFENSDALFFLSTTGEIFKGRDQLLQSILEYVQSGKGFVAFHATADCCRNSPRFLQMIGAEFQNHPWSSKTNAHIFADDPFHPLTTMLEGREIQLREEIYQFKKPYSRDDVKVLLRLNSQRSRPSEKMKLRQDKDFPVSWIKPFGKGRVFYSALGHNAEVYHHPVIAKHFLAGIQYALGDKAVDDRSSRKHPFSLDLLPVEKSYFLMREYLSHAPYPDGHLESLQSSLVNFLDTKEPSVENWPLLSFLKLMPSGKTTPKNKWLEEWLSSWPISIAGSKKRNSRKIIFEKSPPPPDLNVVLLATDRTEFMKNFFLLSTDKKTQVAKALLGKGTPFADILKSFLINERPTDYLSILKENPPQELSSGESPWIHNQARDQSVRVSSFAIAGHLLIDKNPQSRWSSSRLQTRGDFVEVDLGQERTIKLIRVRSESSPGEYARRLKIILGGSFYPEAGTVVFDGQGAPVIEVPLKELKARTVSFEITESFPALWSIGEIEIL